MLGREDGQACSLNLSVVHRFQGSSLQNCNKLVAGKPHRAMTCGNSTHIGSGAVQVVARAFVW
jgi:hypothetical protein